MSKHRTIQAAMVFSCLALIGCSSQSGQQTTSSPAATADQAMWQIYTKQAEDALAKNDKTAAEQNYKLAIAEAEKLGTDTPAVASSTANLADFYYVQGDGNQADDLYKRSLAVMEKIKGTEHVDLVKDLSGLGKVSIMKKKYPEAVSYYERAEDILKQSGMPEQADIKKGLEDAKKLAAAK